MFLRPKVVIYLLTLYSFVSAAASSLPLSVSSPRLVVNMPQSSHESCQRDRKSALSSAFSVSLDLRQNELRLVCNLESLPIGAIEF